MNDDFLRAEKLVDSMIERDSNYSKEMLKTMFISYLANVMENEYESYEFCKGFISTVNSRL